MSKFRVICSGEYATYHEKPNVSEKILVSEEMIERERGDSLFVDRQVHVRRSRRYQADCMLHSIKGS